MRENKSSSGIGVSSGQQWHATQGQNLGITGVTTKGTIMARTSLTTRMDSIEARFDRLESLLVAALEPKAPAKAVTPKAPKARKAQPKAAPKATKALCKSTRLAFIAAAAKEGTDFSNWSTRAIAAACVEDASLVPAGFRLGEGYKALFSA